jgi:hypothetical protein
MLLAHGDDVSDAEICEGLADKGLLPRQGAVSAATGTDGR